MANEPTTADEELDPTDPVNRQTQVFPRLSEDMASRISAYGRVENFAKGTLIFERGQRSIDFFLVLEGSIEIFELDDHVPPLSLASYPRVSSPANFICSMIT